MPILGGMATSDPTRLPQGLPIPEDDGLADHLLGLGVPSIQFDVAGGGSQSLNDFSTRWLVLYAYPRTGGPGIDLPPDWDMIPGARGCTPQGCAFRDHHRELAQLGASVLGVSAQPIEEQAEFVKRMHIPFPLLNDSGLQLAAGELRLPTFRVGDMELYRRLTLIADGHGIRKVFYPVFPPDENASEVVSWLLDRDGDTEEALSA